MSLQTLQNINTSHQHSKNYIGFLSNKESITQSVFSHTKHLQINYLHISTIVFYFHHILFLYTIFWFICSFHSICPIITWQKGFLCHRSTTLEFTLFCPDTRNSSSLPIFRSRLKTHLFKKCVPSLGSFLSPLTVYLDFDSCYSHFVPYRITPNVRHMAIEVHYYYYYSLFSYSSGTREGWKGVKGVWLPCVLAQWSWTVTKKPVWTTTEMILVDSRRMGPSWESTPATRSEDRTPVSGFYAQLLMHRDLIRNTQYDILLMASHLDLVGQWQTAHQRLLTLKIISVTYDSYVLTRRLWHWCHARQAPISSSLDQAFERDCVFCRRQ